MITQGMGAPRDLGGTTGNAIVRGFVSIKTEGIQEMADKLQRIGAVMGEPRALEKAVESAGELIRKGYRSKIHSVTGNLRKSVRIKTKTYESAAVAIVGPWQSGNAGSKPNAASGNHAWLYEFGSGPRKPGSQGRHDYINVHQMINRKMRWHSSVHHAQFAKMSRGYYFLMGSINEPTRQGGAGAFCMTGGKQHPVTLHPGEEYAPMPRSDAMQKTVSEQKQAVMNTLTAAIANTLARLTA